MQCGKCGGRMSENAGGWWTCWGCGNSQPACLRNHQRPGGTTDQTVSVKVTDQA